MIKLAILLKVNPTTDYGLLVLHNESGIQKIYRKRSFKKERKQTESSETQKNEAI